MNEALNTVASLHEPLSHQLNPVQMENSCFPDVFQWIDSLPPLRDWKANAMSFCIIPSTSSQPSLNLSVLKNAQPGSIRLSIVADYSIGLNLWTSKSIQIDFRSMNLLGGCRMSFLLINFMEDVIGYASYKSIYAVKIPMLEQTTETFRDIFNVAFLSLSFLVCIYEAPTDLRPGCLISIHNHLASPDLREASKLLLKFLGSNLEERWMKSINLAITNWIVELQGSNTPVNTVSPLFSYSISTVGLWKTQLYCPVIAMETECLRCASADEKLAFSLKYHQLEGVIQFNYDVTVEEKWIDVVVNIDNVRVDVVRLLNDGLMKERGAGVEEKHFPSRISLHLTPIPQTHIISISVGKSSENPTREIGHEKAIETSIEAPKPYIGVQISAGESVSVSLRPWKFEESVNGYSSGFNWYLHDSVDGREVVTSKPSLLSLLNPRAWFKGRYSSAYRPFTRQGGVIFAGDEYGNSVRWKVDRSMLGKTLEWEIKGWIWLTYLPNRRRTLYSETKKFQFRETVTIIVA